VRRCISDQIADTQRAVSEMLGDERTISTVDRIAVACVECLRAGGKILFAATVGALIGSRE
jgi:D-sedoheptulose 7-phosphate isomerase